MKYNTYTLVRANGKVERCKIPTFFDPYTVAKRLTHSLVFMDLPKGHVVHGFQPDTMGTMISGPAVVMIDKEHHYWMPHAPKDDIEAGRLWRNYGPEIYKQRVA